MEHVRTISSRSICPMLPVCGLLALAFALGLCTHAAAQPEPRRSVTFGVSGKTPPDDLSSGIFGLAACQEQTSDPRRLVVRELYDPTNPVTGRLPSGESLDRILMALVDGAMRASAEGAEVHLACFSWGATMCLRAAQDLDQVGVPLESMILIDRIELAYGGMLPDPDPDTGLPVVPSNVKKVYAVRQQYTDPCSGVPPLCGGDVAIADNNETFARRILISENSSDAEGRLLFTLLRERLGGAPATAAHVDLDDWPEIWVRSGKFVGRDCEGFEAECGNAIREPGEDCDGGDDNLCPGECNPPGHERECLCAECGNGVVDISEECDDGNLNSDTTPEACRTDCRQAHCGDGVVDTGEECDDGNNASGDGCSSECMGEIDLSGTWTICLLAYTSSPAIVDTICFLCPPEVGVCTPPSSLGAEFLPLPWCFSLGFTSNPISVTQTGRSIAGSDGIPGCRAATNRSIK
jgi:cysteine-rich repeat protein